MYDQEVEALLRRMTTAEKVGQMLVASFRMWKEEPGSDGVTRTVENAAPPPPAVAMTALNDRVRECIATYRFGGSVLFAENFHDAAQVLRLTCDLQTACLRGGGLPMILAADQEGGGVNRISFGTPGPGSMALCATGKPGNAADMAEICGRELRLLGLHADYAPVLDVNSEPANPVIGVRAFSDDPHVTAVWGKAYQEGLHRAGVMSTVKHFPGHGNTATDSHTGFPCIRSTLPELRERELVPFRAAIDAGADMVMTAHIQFPRIETETRTSLSTGEPVCLPATMSRTLLTDVLRGEMGFEGVIVTDALDMAAISENFSDEDVIRTAVQAGADMLMLPLVTDAARFRRVRDMAETALRLAKEGSLSPARIDDAVRRILTLKKKYGLLAQRAFPVTDALVRAAQEGVGCPAHREAARRMAREALTLVRNENGAFPLRPRPGESTLVLFADACASRRGSAMAAERELRASGLIPPGASILGMVSTRDNGDECVARALECDHVILVSRVYSPACLDPRTEDGFSTAVFDRILAARHAAGKTVLAVSCQLPYDAARFPDADAMLLTYGSSPMQEVPPENGHGSACVPSLPAALCACFGAFPPAGTLPVNIPRLHEDHSLSRDILYRSGHRA